LCIDGVGSNVAARRFGYSPGAFRVRGYDDAQARRILRDLIDMPADIAIAANEVPVRFHRRAHLPILLASGLIDQPVAVPRWQVAAKPAALGDFRSVEIQASGCRVAKADRGHRDGHGARSRTAR